MSNTEYLDSLQYAVVAKDPRHPDDRSRDRILGTFRTKACAEAYMLHCKESGAYALYRISVEDF